MGLYNEFFGNADKLLPSLWDMVSYPFGGGTNKADQIAVQNKMSTTRPVRPSGWGTFGKDPTTTPLYVFQNPVKVVTEDFVVPTAKVVAPAIKSVVNAVIPSNVGNYVVLGLGAILLIKLLK